MKEIIETEINGIINRTAEVSNHMDRLYEFFMHHVALVKEKPYIARFIAVEARQNENFIRRNPGYNPLLKYLDFVKEVTTSAIQENQIKTIDAEALALLLVGSMDIVLWNWLAGENEMDIDTIGQRIRQILHAGVALVS